MRALSSSPNLFTQQPMFWAACAYSAGIATASVMWRPMAWWLVAGLMFLFFAAALRTGRTVASAVLALASLFCAGASHFELSAAAAPSAPDLVRFTDGNEVIVTAHVVRTGLPRATQNADERREVLDVETESLEGVWGRAEASFGIRVTVRSNVVALPEEGVTDAAAPPATAFRYGERLRFPAKLREPRNYGNPGAMDYRGYLRDKGIAALASVAVEKFESLPGFRGLWLENQRDRARKAVAEAMLRATSRESSWMSLSREDAALLLAMVIGEQSLLERTTRADFQRTGVFHILVVSGMNVGMLALFVFWVARKLRAGPLGSACFTVFVCLAYVAVTDLGTPVLRAAVMLCIYLIARLFFRDRYSLNAVGVAAGLLLLYAPDSVFEPSFQLTFLSMVALSGIVQPLLEATSQPYKQATRGLELLGWDISLPPKSAQFRLDLRLLIGKLSQLLGGGPRIRQPITWLVTRSVAGLLTLYELVVVSAVMQLALALPMSIYFHRAALLGVPTNILVVPLTGLLMPAALGATLIEMVFHRLAAPVWSLSALCLHAISFVVSYAAGLRFVEWRMGTPAMIVAILSASLLAFAVLVARRSSWGLPAALASVTLGAILVISLPHPRTRAGTMEVTVIDVGQGDAILMITPDGKTLLVDAGGPAGPFRTDNFDLGEDVVSPYLWSRGISRLDAVAVTHAHSDHLAGMPAVIANFRPREVWLGLESDPQRYAAVKQAAGRFGAQVKHSVAGETLTLGAMEFAVLNPPRDLPVTTRRNEDSLVLLGRYRESRVLLTGDAERRTEEHVAQAAEPVSLLKVAHHGSGTSTTPELLERAQPQFAAISAGYRNLYGHPRQDVLTRLREANVRVFRTDVSGAVTFYLDGKQTTVDLAAMR